MTSARGSARVGERPLAGAPPDLPRVRQEQPDWAVHDVTRRHSKHFTTRTTPTARTQPYSTTRARRVLNVVPKFDSCREHELGAPTT